MKKKEEEKKESKNKIKYYFIYLNCKTCSLHIKNNILNKMRINEIFYIILFVTIQK